MSKTTPETWADRFKQASGTQEAMFKRYSSWYDALYAVPGTTPSPWRSKMYVPVLARQTWALVSKFLTLQPGFEIKVVDDAYNNEDIEMKAEKAQKKLQYDYNNPYLDESIRDKLFSVLLDATVTGTGLAKVPWCVHEKVTYKRKAKKDGTWDLTQEEKTTRKIGYNDLEPVNIFNVFVSSAATNLYDAPWIIIKEFKTLSELKATNKAQGGIYKNLDQLSGSTNYRDDAQTFNQSRNRLLNQNDKTDSTVNMVKLFECYEGDMIYTYAEATDDSKTTSWVLLREQKNPYWHGKYPLVKFHVKNRPYSFWGEGLFETTYRLQAGYNDVFNHVLDQWNLSENSMLIAPERANINDYIIEPGGVITYRGDIKPEQFKHAAPDFQGTQILLQLMDSAVEGVTISNYASGIPNSSSDKTKGTATGILKLQQAAGDLVSFMKGNFTQSITQIGRMWLSNNQQYMAEPIKVAVNNKGRSEPIEITPEDMQGDMDLLVDDASMEPTSKDEQRAAHIAFNQQLLALKQAADIQAQSMGTTPMPLDFTELAEDLSEKFGIKNFTSIILPEEQIKQAQMTMQQNMQQAQQAGQKPQAQPKTPSESINYKDAPEDIKRQIEAQAGLQPSQGVSPAGTDQMAKMAQTDQQQAKTSFDMQQQATQNEHSQMLSTADHILKARTQQDNTETQRQGLFARMRGGNDGSKQ